MKSVLISIQPQWCREIWDGNKTVEVRRTFPRAKDLPYPFKCYIYCSKEKPWLVQIIRDGDMYGIPPYENEVHKGTPVFIKAPRTDCMDWHYQGHVIGEFICDNIERLDEWVAPHGAPVRYKQPLAGCSCVSDSQLAAYGNGKPLYGWHISQLQKYKEYFPAELAFFHLKRPPMSWCYVDSLEE